MTELDEEIVPLALEIISRYGSKITFNPLATAYDVATGSTTEGTVGVEAWITPPQPYKQYLVDGESILATDVQTYMAAKDVTPEPKVGDLLVYQGQTFKMMAVQPIRSGDMIALYALQLR